MYPQYVWVESSSYVIKCIANIYDIIFFSTKTTIVKAQSDNRKKFLPISETKNVFPSFADRKKSPPPPKKNK